MGSFGKTVRRLFLPRPGNNHQARLRQSVGMWSLIWVVLLIQVWVQVAVKAYPMVLGYASNITVESILDFTNQKRIASGIGELRLDDELSAAARWKAADMFERDYWAHVTPTGEQPWRFITDSGYVYLYAGENLARDFMNSADVVEAWMNSASHRENLLNGNYDDIGIAVENGELNGVETTLVVQMFGARKVPTSLAQVKETEATEEVAGESAPLVVEVTPTAEPTAVALAQVDEPIVPESSLVAAVEPVGVEYSPVTSPFEVSRAVGLAVVILLGGVLIIDELVMMQKRLGRIAGRSWAHLMFLVMTVGVLWLSKSGIIL